MTSKEPAYKTAIHKTRRKGTRIRFKDAMWYQHYFPNGEHAVRFLNETEFRHGDQYEILREGEEE